jgi:DNA polymerase sigma
MASCSYRSNSSSSDRYSKLSSQIRDEFKSIESTANSSLAAKLRWAKELEKRIVNRVLPESRLILVGSSTNLFGFRHSDCDLTVVTKDKLASAFECLRKIESALKSHRRQFDVEVSSTVLFKSLSYSHPYIKSWSVCIEI